VLLLEGASLWLSAMTDFSVTVLVVRIKNLKHNRDNINNAAQTIHPNDNGG